MVSRRLNFDRQTAILRELIGVVFVWIICAVPLAAQLTVGTGTPGAAFTLQLGDAVPAAISQSANTVPESADALIEQMTLAAGVIFAGEVTAVRLPVGFAGSEQDAAEGIVEIDLRVDQSLRGAAAGSIYTVREWAGLWAGEMARYKAGQRLLLFLYAPDTYGLSAPVHGAEGAIPLRGSGAAPGPDDASTAVSEWLVDLRWLQAQALRTRRYAMLPVRRPGGPITGPVSEEAAVVRPGLRPGLRQGSNFGEAASERTGREPEDVIQPALLQPALVQPALVHAIREPWASSAPAEAATQPLSEVLALCQQALTLQAGTQDRTRRRDASH